MASVGLAASIKFAVWARFDAMKNESAGRLVSMLPSPSVQLAKVNLFSGVAVSVKRWPMGSMEPFRAGAILPLPLVWTDNGALKT